MESPGDVMVNPAPSPKTTTTGTSGAAVLLIVWCAGQFGLEIPAVVAAAAVLLATTAVAWFMPDREPGKYEAE